jgi:hypothetical protein
MNKVKQIAKLTRLARKLWASLVKLQYNGKCAVCGSTQPPLNAHHIESYRMCKALRFDPMNGVLLCARKHHRFGYPAAHTSWIVLYMILQNAGRIHYLRERHRDKPPEITAKYLETVIKNLKEEIEQHGKNN